MNLICDSCGCRNDVYFTVGKAPYLAAIKCSGCSSHLLNLNEDNAQDLPASIIIKFDYEFYKHLIKKTQLSWD